MDKETVDVHKINATSVGAYLLEGPGIGGNKDALKFLKNMGKVTLGPGMSVLDVGFGEGHDLVEAHRLGANAYGVDIAPASIEYMANLCPGVKTYLLDGSKQPLPFADDSMDVVIFTEAIEHFTDIYHVCAEIKRVLKHDGAFLCAFPDFNNNGGYDGGQHAHVYPGFLTPKNFQTFMRQLYFHKPVYIQNGASSWFCYRNYKGAGIFDTFYVIAGNYTEAQLFHMLDSSLTIMQA